MLGRLGACVLAQIPRLRALLLHNICLFGAGLSAVFIPLCYDYITMSITAFGYGLFMGMWDQIVAKNMTYDYDYASSLVNTWAHCSRKKSENTPVYTFVKNNSFLSPGSPHNWLNLHVWHMYFTTVHKLYHERFVLLPTIVPETETNLESHTKIVKDA